MSHPGSGKPAHGRMLVVIPVLSFDIADPLFDSLRMEANAAELTDGDLLVIDNTRTGGAVERYTLPTYRDPDGHNLGVARSWNVGVRRLLESDREYLTLMSASMQFGPILHTSWTRQMLAFWGENVIEAEGHSWHLISFHRRVFEKVGLFDECLYPAYFEATDMSFRMRQVGWEGSWTRVWVNALSRGVGAHLPLISCPADPLLGYMRAKWGGDKGEETFCQPFGDQPLDYFPKASIPELAERYGLETWW